MNQRDDNLYLESALRTKKFTNRPQFSIIAHNFPKRHSFRFGKLWAILENCGQWVIFFYLVHSLGINYHLSG